MSRPLIVSIPHSLGKAEAQRRLQGGMGQVKTSLGDKLTSIEDTWTGDRMDFKGGALGQNVSGHLQVMDDSVRLEVVLPWVFQVFAEKAKGYIQKQGTLMLEKK